MVLPKAKVRLASLMAPMPKGCGQWETWMVGLPEPLLPHMVWAPVVPLVQVLIEWTGSAVTTNGMPRGSPSASAWTLLR